MAQKATGNARALEKQARALLQGAIDFHIHTGPDVFPRKLSDSEAARQARKAGMQAILIKSHVTITADRAQIAHAATGFPVFGGVVLNWQVGGLNKYAVDCAAKLGARQVWMPTVHAANFVRQAGHVSMLAKSLPGDIQGISILKKDGRLIPEIGPILEIIAEKGMILGTGHLSPAEGLALIREAKEAGVEKIVVTHPMARFINYSVEQMRQALSLGATYLEHVFNDCTPNVSDPIPPGVIGDGIKAIGPEHCIISTDAGQVINPPPVEVMVWFIREMLEYGFSVRAIQKMVRTNPKRILGLAR